VSRDAESKIPDRGDDPEQSGIWDCHVHVGIDGTGTGTGTGASTSASVGTGPRAGTGVGIGAEADADLNPERSLERYLGSVAQMLGVEHIVLVQPSALENDHRALLGALDLMAGKARGIVLLGEVLRDPEGARRRGVRGVRFAPRLRQGGALEEFMGARSILRDTGMHVQVYADGDQLPEILGALDRAGLHVVLDHFARLAPGAEPTQAFQCVHRMLSTGRCHVKLSGAYHVAAVPAEIDRLGSVARALFDANPDALLWGSDWPHPRARWPIDSCELLSSLARWGFDAREQQRILIDNPGRLYT
jgi:predicted TIM-barrel fold metal-dependent hydrolase